MKREVIVTADGSKTLYLPEWDEHYHSKFGALEESMHIFINNGLKTTVKNAVSVFEIGFGTGLNALLSCKWAIENKVKVYYESIEKYPVNEEELKSLEYKYLDEDKSFFDSIQNCQWNTEVDINPFFTLKKIEADIKGYTSENKFDVVYFDAFAPDLQPDIWTEEVFLAVFNSMNPGGILMTYTTKGTVKRGLKSVGFEIEKIPGPKGGKREVLRVVKPG